LYSAHHLIPYYLLVNNVNTCGQTDLVTGSPIQYLSLVVQYTIIITGSPTQYVSDSQLP